MPAVISHYLLAKRFSLKEGELASSHPSFDDFLEKNFVYFALGSQGPDPLFFTGIIPFRGLHLPTAMKKIGNQIHKTDAKKYFRLLIEECFKIEPEKHDFGEQKQFKAFVFGQFAHYLLDKYCHPYVLYESGFDDDGKITGEYHYLHSKIETEIDYCLAKKYKTDHILDKPGDLLKCIRTSSRNDPLAKIDAHLVPVLKKTFDLKYLPKHMYSNGLKNYRTILNYTNGGSSLRVALFKKTNLAAMRMPKEVKEDVLNENREKWYHPVSNTPSNASFLELHSKAFDELQSLFIDIMENGFSYEVFLRHMDDKDYYGCVPNSKWMFKKNIK